MPLKPFAYVVVFLLVLSGSASTSAPSGDSFDAPFKKKVVDFGPSPWAQGYRIRLFCFFYPTFAVKVYDQGQKGAAWHAIMPIQQGVAPACERSHAPG